MQLPKLTKDLEEKEKRMAKSGHYAETLPIKVVKLN